MSRLENLVFYLIDNWVVCLIIISLVFITGGTIGYIAAYFQALPVKGWYEQAYSAADAEQMEMWLDKLLKEMKDKNMTHGHYALFFKNPHNDVALDYRVFEMLKNRCIEVQKYPKGSMDYATSLQDIREQMSKTDFKPWYWYFCNFYTICAWLLLIGIPLLFIALMIWAFLIY